MPTLLSAPVDAVAVMGAVGFHDEEPQLVDGGLSPAAGDDVGKPVQLALCVAFGVVRRQQFTGADGVSMAGVPTHFEPVAVADALAEIRRIVSRALDVTHRTAPPGPRRPACRKAGAGVDHRS